MKISMERAWDRAIALLKGNKDVLAVLAGVFFFVPAFAEVFFMAQQPQIVQGMSPEEMLPLLEAYARAILPYVIVVAVVSAIGQLAMLVLFTDRSRPTVHEALKRALVALVAYVLVTLIVWLGLSFIGAALVAAPAKAGAQAVAAIAFVLLVPLTLYVLIKVSLAPAVIVAERTANPLTAIARSWRLTRHNSLRLLLFYALLFIPYLVILLLAQGLLGAVGAIVGGQQGQLFVGGAASAAVAAVWGTLSAAIVAALYEQLAGRPEPDLAKTFD